MARSSRLRFGSRLVSRSLPLAVGTLASAALLTAATLVACGNSDDGAPAGKDGSVGDATDNRNDGGAPGSDSSAPPGDSGPSQLSFKPSNIDLSTVDLSGAGDADITSSCVFSFTGPADGSNSCAPSAFAYAYLTQGDGSSVGVFIARSIHVEAGAVVSSGVGTVSPVVLVSLGTFLVDGVIDMSADDSPGGISPGGYTFSGSNWNSMGLGPGGGGAASMTNAGGGGGYCGTGGKGAAFEDAGSNAAGGATYGTATLIPLVGGSTGGVGGVNNYAESEPGSGGGAVQLVAGTSIIVSDGGALGAGGGPGQQAYDQTTQAAGGGSGGAILLEAPSVTIAGVIAVNGGGGGGGGGQIGNGAFRTAPYAYTAVFAGGGNDYTGGNGNGTLPGDAGIGVPATTNGSDGVPQDNGNDPGAGGGGGGRIRINTSSGHATITGVLSPDITDTTCVTQGTLGH